MLQRFHTDDLFAIAHYLGMLIIFLSVTMLVPLIVACLFGEWAVATHYIVGIGVAFFIGSLLRLCKANPKRLTRMQAIAITGLAWVVGALFSAIPLYLSGHYASFLDSVFECVSGFTTTGLSLTLDIDHMSMADSMWRCGIQFLGGQGILVIALSLGLFTKTGTSFYNSEGREEAILPNMRKTTQFIMRFAFMIVIAGTLVLGVVAMSVGMDPIRSFFHGLWITIGSYDTGGFAVQSLSVSYYHSWPFEIVTMVIMCLGTVNFGLFAYVQKTGWREFLRDIEIRSLAIWILAMVVVFVAAMMAGNFLTDYLGLIRRGIFTIISATTNTGYQVLSSNQMATLMTSGAFFLIALSMAVGGSSGSTAGGIKALRVGLIAKGIVARVKQVLLP
ncbi:MAG: hypothetical protein LBM21_01545, partial [Coriobacteriales bacterium]|nr:hypothetical protein [Coriobacteriales bacterium]